MELCSGGQNFECLYHKDFTDKDRLRDIIEDELCQAYNAFIFYERKLDKRLPHDAIQKAIVSGIISTEELAQMFKSYLDNAVKTYKDSNDHKSNN